MNRLVVGACLLIAGVWALAVFARVEAGYWARRAWRWVACAWMQCDEVRE